LVSASVAVAGDTPIMQGTIQAAGAMAAMGAMGAIHTLVMVATVATVVILTTLTGTIPFTDIR